MSERSPITPDRFFSAEPVQRKIARQLYDSVLNLPIVCPCIRLDSWLLPDKDPDGRDPCELLIFSDEYILRRLHSQGINLGKNNPVNKEEKNSLHRKIWQAFVDNSFTLRSMPADIWLSEILYSVFGIKEKLAPKNAMRIYNILSESLKQPEFRSLKLLERFNIESLGVLESPTNPSINLNNHGSGGRIIPCFSPDILFFLNSPEWRHHINQLAETCQVQISDYRSFLHAIQKQRLLFKSLGATTIVQSIYAGETALCLDRDIDLIFMRALRQEATIEDAQMFANRLLVEMASMSTEDNLVLQLRIINPGVVHSGKCSPGFPSSSFAELIESSGLKSLLELFGQDNRITLVLFPDEMIFNEGLKKLADYYPSVKIGTPGWFFDGLSSMQIYFDSCIENIGLYKSTGLNNMCSSFLSIPSQHDIWRRSSANWLAKLVTCGLVDLESAYEMVYAMAYGLAKSTYRL